MRRMLGSTAVGACLLFAVLAGQGAGQGALGPTMADSPYAPAQNGRSSELITHLTGSDGQPLVLTVIDPREQWIGVYHVDRASGEIALKSARRYTWDLQLIEFNSGKPKPQDIRSGLPH